MQSNSIVSPKEVENLKLDVISSYDRYQIAHTPSDEPMAVINAERAAEYVRVFRLYGVRPLEAVVFYTLAEIPDDIVTDKGMYDSINKNGGSMRERIKYTVDKLAPLVNGSRLSPINRLVLRTLFAVRKIL